MNWRSRELRFVRICGKLQARRRTASRADWLVNCARMWNWVDHQPDPEMLWGGMLAYLPDAYCDVPRDGWTEKVFRFHYRIWDSPQSDYGQGGG